MMWKAEQSRSNTLTILYIVFSLNIWTPDLYPKSNI